MATRKGRQATRGGSPQKPAWVWLLVGLVLGAGLMLMVFIKGWVPLLRPSNLPQPNPQAVAPKASEAPVAEAKPRPSYDFYQVLPEAEVVIPDAELSAKARAEQQARTAAGTPAAPQGTPPTSSGGRYVLQVGSYPDPRAAEEAKARLALTGFSASIQPVTINGKTWHRVRVGPYASAGDLEAAKRNLADNGIKAIALKEQP